VLRAAPGCWNGQTARCCRLARGPRRIQWRPAGKATPEQAVGHQWPWTEGLDTGPVLLEKRLTIGCLSRSPAPTGTSPQASYAELLVAAMPLNREGRSWPGSRTAARLEVRPSPVSPTSAMPACWPRRISASTGRLSPDTPCQVMGLYPGAPTASVGGEAAEAAGQAEPLVARLGGQLSSQAASWLRPRTTGNSSRAD